MATGPGTEVEGARELAATLTRAANDLEGLAETTVKVPRHVTDVARARAPRVSGALAASGQPGTEKGAALVMFTAAYAGVINYGWPARNIYPQPFATDAALETQPTWLDMYADTLNDILGRVHGA